jgi:LPS-assembly lipoprotein
MRDILAKLCLPGLALLLAGCGFSPTYAPSTHAAAGMGHIFVSPIADRTGQELRQALQLRMDDGSDSGGKTLVLDVVYTVSGQGLSIQSDNSSTRTRETGAASWRLHNVADAKTLAAGQTNALDGFNVMNGQYFYGDLSTEAAEKRLAEELADQIVARLAVYFKTHPDNT